MSRRKKNQSDPEQAAESLLEKYRISAPAVPVDKIAKQEGARIQYGPLDRELSGMFFFKDDAPVIGVNSLHHPNRQRFTIAHELAHMLLHSEQLAQGVHVDKEHAILWRDALAASGTDSIEIEANRFASYLLVPSFILDKIIGDDFKATDDEVESLAKRFKVSTTMMQLRLQKWLSERNGP